MAFTENYVILNDFPLFWDAEMLKHNAHIPPRLHRDLPSRFGILPRRGGSGEIRWFEAATTYVLHFTNAFEEGDEIVLDGFFQGTPEPTDAGTADGMDPRWQRFFRYLSLDGMQTRLHRWRFNLSTGQTHEEQLSDSLTEFGMINPSYAAKDYRYTYAATGKPGWFLFDGLVRHDLHTGSEQRYAFADGGVRQRDRHGAAHRQHRRRRRLPRHHHDRYDRRCVVLSGVRRCRPRRRTSVQTSTAGTGFQRNALDLARVRSCGAGGTDGVQPPL